LPAFSIGRICVKKKGREKGLKCVVVDEIDDNYVLVTGPKKISGVRRRRANVDHLSPTDKIIRIRRGASDQDVTSALTRANLINFMSGKPISLEGSGAEQ
jgi:large subunit ribosomal protein L14e